MSENQEPGSRCRDAKPTNVPALLSSSGESGDDDDDHLAGVANESRSLPSSNQSLSVHSFFVPRRSPSSETSLDMRKVTFVGGKGAKVFTKDGVHYLDCISSDVILGHGHEKVSECLSKQTLFGNLGFLSSSVADLSRKLVSMMPPKLTACFFVNSSSEANDLALALALHATGSEEVISIDRAYHGSTYAFIKHSKNAMQSRNKHSRLAVLPDSYRGKFRDSNFPADDVGWMYATDVKEICSRLSRDNKKVGAFICKPIMHSSGHVILPNRYLHEVFDCIRAHDGVVIIDESFTGLGRSSGEHLWGFQKHNVVPDIVTIGKSLGNGLPIAAVVTTKEIAKKFTQVAPYHRFLGDPASCQIGLTVLQQIQESNILENVKEIGDFLYKEFVSLMDCFSFVGDIRSLGGLSIALDLVQRGSREAHPILAQIVRQKLFERHVIVDLCGYQRNVLCFTPPLCVTLSEASQIVSATRDALDEAEQSLVSKRRSSSAKENSAT